MTSPAALTGIRQVRLERRGGFAGLQQETALDWSALSPSQRQAVARLMEKTSHGSAAPSPGADRFCYRVHLVPESGPERSIEVGEETFPAELESLLRPGD